MHVLIYETVVESGVSPATRLAHQAEQLPGVSATLFGQGEHFDGYGSKYSAVLPVLQKMDPTELVVLSDGRDVLINNPAFGNSATAQIAIAEFRAAFDALTSQNPHAVVVSAEAQCCVSALTFAQPGDYFSPDGSRAQKACNSGKSNCLWNGDDKAEPWEIFMQTLAQERTGDKNFEDVYLNAGLMAGRVEDLIHVIESVAIENEEDDQAVLTDYMYQYQDTIILDYGQTLFGNNRASEEDSCIFALPSSGVNGQDRLVHTKTQTAPLFVHSPGGLLKCHEELSHELGMEEVSRTSRRRLLQWKEQKFNYKKTGDKDCDKKLGDKDAGKKSWSDDKDGGKKSWFDDKVGDKKSWFDDKDGGKSWSDDKDGGKKSWFDDKDGGKKSWF